MVALEQFLREKDGYSVQALLKSTKKSLNLSCRILEQFFDDSPKIAVEYVAISKLLYWINKGL